MTLPGFEDEDKSLVKFRDGGMKKKSLVKGADLTKELVRED